MTTPQRVDVERFDPCISSERSDARHVYPTPDMEHAAFGEYVKHEAYAALLQQVADLQDALVMAQNAAESRRERYQAAESKLAERDAEIERLTERGTNCERLLAERCADFNFAERAREAAIAMCKRIVNFSDCEMGDGDTARSECAAFLAANGGDNP